MIRYTSLLIRIWKGSEHDTDDSSTQWHAEVEQIQTSRCMTFDSPGELYAHFERYVQHAEDWETNGVPDLQVTQKRTDQ